MSNFRGNRRNYRGGHRDYKKSEPKSVDTDGLLDSPLILQFKAYAKELVDKQDRYERITKISRDITIESKRIIFLLHTIDSRKNNKEEVLADAKNRIDKVFAISFLAIAKELAGLDTYQYSRSFSAGLQEFIEAYTFYEYLSGIEITGWETIQEKLTFEIPEKIEKIADVSEKSEDEVSEGVGEISLVEPTATKQIQCFVQPSEYILGLADLTGEIMRNCINSLGNGDTEECFNSRAFLQDIYAKYLSIKSIPNRSNRDLSHKIFTLKQSTLKTETVCYSLKVRGNEAAKWSSVDLRIQHEDNEVEDEGFY